MSACSTLIGITELYTPLPLVTYEDFLFCPNKTFYALNLEGRIQECIGALIPVNLDQEAFFIAELY